ncbi:hypothetical protein CMI47_08220, partial [Candidatus Pacearchaeota archaeon]|nr:hypothetical protein [Candidatus Pacearchaeota archaeon]
NATTGKVTNAGFVVGQKLPQANGNVGANTYAVENGDLGRTHFLGCYMSESAGSTIFSDAGISHWAMSASSAEYELNGDGCIPVLRGVLMAASGVIPLLSASTKHATGSNNKPSNTAPAIAGNHGASLQGCITGAVNLSNQEFVLLLNGHKDTDDYPNTLTCSFDLRSSNYFADVLNTDPFKVEESGHYLYSSYDVHPSLAVITGSGYVYPGSGTQLGGAGGPTLEPVAFITTGAHGRNAGTAATPDYEGFETRFSTAKSPYVISQDFGGTKYNLFRVHAIDDGHGVSTKFKVSIENIQKSTSDTNFFGAFDLIVRDFYDSDDEKVVLEQYRGLSLNPSSDRFIARVIGDQRAFYDFDRNDGSQRIVVEGDHPVQSNLIRVEQSRILKDGAVPDEALPIGSRGQQHLVTSGSQSLHGAGIAKQGQLWASASNLLHHIVEPPSPMRESVSVGVYPNDRAKSYLYWGIQFTRKESVSEPNRIGLHDNTLDSFAKYFPTFRDDVRNVSVGDNAGVSDANGTILDSDRFNNNMFTLERIKVRTGSNGLADPAQWVSASYVRQGGITTNETTKTRAFKVDDLKNSGNRNFAKFTFFLQGGFDGVNVFNKSKRSLLNNSCKWEMDDSGNQGGTDGPTVAAYRKAVDIMETKSDVDIKLLAIPGIRHNSVTDYAVDAVEDRFDALYIMDIEERDTTDQIVTGSLQNVNVGYTVAAFKNRSLDTSFAAAYFPDTIVRDPTTLTNVQVPPSVSVLGAFSRNDRLGHPWYAPAGFTRGALSAERSALPLKRANLDDLYDADINPITTFPGTGLVVWGQKTLLSSQSSLDRVNVRRLLIEIRRSVRSVANSLLFEPNRSETLDRFNALVTPILQSIQEKSGVDRYKVVIDASTTTQADIENNTLRGKIYVQPTRTAEFIALDFMVSNAGAEI